MEIVRTVAALLPIIGIVFLFLLADRTADESNESFGSQSIRGRYRVLYEDGQRSQPMNLTTARSYASMFNGTVIRR